VSTSSLGTHTFFMIALPMLFFFGYDELGRGLLFNLAFGVYTSSFVKDLVCSPRPFSPPVTRLTISTHHLEYGFPSTHSTNAVSIALFVFSHVHAAYTAPASTMTPAGYALACTVLAVYAFSIVLGRVYTAMHSATDCVAGVVMGAAVWAAYEGVKPALERWLASGSWSVPLTTIPACLLMVHFHPQPVDDCPCFEDAIAFVSVVLGGWLARWHIAYADLSSSYLSSASTMPGSLFTTWDARALWWGVALLKVGTGVLVIFAWRILAKVILHRVLPPLFRALAACVRLPNRRFYTPATDYAHVEPAEGLRPIPSVIDLHALADMDGDGGRAGASGVYGNNNWNARGNGNGALKRRNGLGPSPLSESGEKKEQKEKEERRERGKAGVVERGGKDEPGVSHYDADVLTKVVVYAGIALLACEAIPVMFTVLGWGVRAY